MGESLVEVVERVRAIPYGRPSVRTPAGVLAENRGTCSTKHALLAELLAARWPELEPRLVHRVYTATRATFGDAAPAEGVVDVHTYLVVSLAGRSVRLDVTFPGGPRWGGSSDMELACGEGVDFDDEQVGKDELVRRYCDPAVREPFIAALPGSGA